MIAKEDVPEHMKSYCLNTVVSCPFYPINCHVTMMKKDLSNHMNENINNHLTLHFQHYYQTYQSFGDLNTNLTRWTAQIDDKLTAIDRDIGNVFTILKDKDNDARFESLEKEDKSLSDRILFYSTRIKELQDIIGNLNETINKNNTVTENLIKDIEILKEERGSKKVKKSLLGIKRQRTEEDSTFDDTTSCSDNYFKKELSCNSISIKKNIATYKTDTNDHAYLFLNKDLTKTTSWKIIFNETRWIGIGCCIYETVKANDFIFTNTSINGVKDHGCFIISPNNFSWNCNKKDENNVAIKLPNFQKTGNKLTLKYYHEDKELHYILNKKLIAKLTNVTASDDQTLLPCIIFYYAGDEISTE
jgi:hypothetical protein